MEDNRLTAKYYGVGFGIMHMMTASVLWGSCLGKDRCFYNDIGGKNMAAVASLGLGKTMEKKLHSVGIHSAEELKEIGSKQAVFRLKEQYPNTCVVILYYLEAAIRGVEMKQLEDTCKAELRAWFKQL